MLAWLFFLGLPKTTRVCVDSSDIKMLKRLWVAGGRALAIHGLSFKLEARLWVAGGRTLRWPGASHVQVDLNGSSGVMLQVPYT